MPFSKDIGLLSDSCHLSCLNLSWLDNVITESGSYYRKVPKFLDTQNICCNHAKLHSKASGYRVMPPKDAHLNANSEDPNQFDLGLQCLPRPICPKTKGYYGRLLSLNRLEGHAER